MLGGGAGGCLGQLLWDLRAPGRLPAKARLSRASNASRPLRPTKPGPGPAAPVPGVGAGVHSPASRFGGFCFAAGRVPAAKQRGMGAVLPWLGTLEPARTRAWNRERAIKEDQLGPHSGLCTDADEVGRNLCFKGIFREILRSDKWVSGTEARLQTPAAPRGG